jgi:signal transduction histidine kinase
MPQEYPIRDEEKTRDMLLRELAELRSTASEVAEMKKELGRLDKVLRMAVTTAQEETARAEAVISALDSGVSIQDTDFKVLLQNRSHRERFGDHVGEYCYTAYRSRGTVCEGCHLALSFQDGKVHRAEEVSNTADGARYHEIVASPLRDPKGTIVAGVELVSDVTERRRAEEEKERLIARLQNALADIRTMNGLLPICSSCKKIRDGEHWGQVEEYFSARLNVEFSHSLCPDCIEKLYPDYYRRER